jgi:signal transduction histidine kinase
MVRTELHGVRESGIAPSSILSEAIERLLRMTDASLDELHRIVDDLGPRDLGMLGLDVALSQLLDDYAARTGQSAVVRLDAPMVSEGTARALFRIAQGCLSNIERHARAHRVEVDCHRVDDPATGRSVVRMTVRDDGVGIGEGADGFGLTSMHTRASELGGSLAVTKHPDGGTLVSVELPLTGQDPT